MCSCDRDSVVSLRERRSLRASRREDVTSELKRWDRDRPIDPTIESTFFTTAALGIEKEMGDEIVVQEKGVPCSNGGATV
jgi:hypothetical protein